MITYLNANHVAFVAFKDSMIPNRYGWVSASLVRSCNVPGMNDAAKVTGNNYAAAPAAKVDASYKVLRLVECS